MNFSSRSLRRPRSALCISGEAFRRFRTLETTRHTGNSSVSSKTEDSSASANSVINIGRLCNFSYSDKDGNAELIMADSIPILYKNQPLTHAAMGTDVNPKHRISKFASDSSSNWSAKIDSSSMSGFTNLLDELSFPTHFGKKRKPVCVKKPNFGQSYSTGAGANYNSDLSEDLSKFKGFDICFSGSKKNPKKMHKINWHNVLLKREDVMLKPGMFLLKKFCCEFQVYIVEMCRALGVRPGGFDQPVYTDGKKIDEQMMCLGLNWNPQRLTYEFIRSVDGCDVPPIPSGFRFMAEQILIYAQSKDVIPSFFPNTCIVSFYSAATGRLCLHQDCSERTASLSKRLPVVSIHVGDSAEFLYGDERDMHKAEKVILESGDALIFGGKSRHIYYGLSSFIPNSAPEFLLEETRLRPGCLNLTFKEA